MAKLALSQLEQATTVPAGSLYLVEMGDGSGTKTVTQETMVEETGKALKIGNMEELQTENKTSIVAAINEVKRSGGSGGTPVDILDSQEEIEANTEAGKAAGALAVQEMFGALNDKLNGNILTYNESEDAYYIQYGADSVPKKLGSAVSLVDATIKGTYEYTGPNTVTGKPISQITGLTIGKYYLIATASYGVNNPHTFSGCDVIWQAYSYGGGTSGNTLRIALVKATSETITSNVINESGGAWIFIDFSDYL